MAPHRRVEPRHWGNGEESGKTGLRARRGAEIAREADCADNEKEVADQRGELHKHPCISAEEQPGECADRPERQKVSGEVVEEVTASVHPPRAVGDQVGGPVAESGKVGSKPAISGEQHVRDEDPQKGAGEQDREQVRSLE